MTCWWDRDLWDGGFRNVSDLGFLEPWERRLCHNPNPILAEHEGPASMNGWISIIGSIELPRNFHGDSKGKEKWRRKLTSTENERREFADGFGWEEQVMREVSWSPALLKISKLQTKVSSSSSSWREAQIDIYVLSRTPTGETVLLCALLRLFTAATYKEITQLLKKLKIEIC